MALIDPTRPIHYDIPHEPGEWVELLPITARDIAAVQRSQNETTPAERTLQILARNLKAWSYAVPINEESLGNLDFQTFNWLDAQILMTGRRDEDEKKESELAYSRTTELVAANSLPNSDT